LIGLFSLLKRELGIFNDELEKIMSNIEFFTVGGNSKKAPEWQRTAGIDNNNDVYAPAIICGDESMVMMSATFDGEPIATYDDHVFLRIKWMRQNNPLDLELLNKIERRILLSKHTA
jgi:hypothetical protein